MAMKLLEDLIPIKIEEEYRRSNELKPELITEFRSWIITHSNLPKCIPDVMLAFFLHSANYEIEEAKKYITNCIKLRSNTPEFFENRDPDNESMQKVWKLVNYWVTKESTAENYQILYAGYLDSDATNYHFGDAAKAFLMVGEWHLLTNGSTPGLLVIMDAKGTTYRHLLKVKINLIMKFLSYIQDALPVKIREIHVINVIPVIDKAMFLAKPFIKKELIDKMIFYPSSKLAEFYKKVPQEMLPSELGGKARTRQELQEETLHGLRKMNQWFLADEKYLRINSKESVDGNEITESNIKSEEPEGLFHSLCID